ncbi:Golgi reassembly-stacking protein 2 [Neodiprion pinetum]|uniref:Golgi reassembly-stacking protein 2 n=1 Tax=Neodiprion lecontei TaxID=441921 RepID=A0A6J0C359_NEOLC|nr:Golgi reassembly-stacking protein 2 [Neodiprion lecontei]XP_046421559.1 Golgi reassembly-stacking protein 2 [Neodiprion fabricii]XP_046477891.1 Golgi reassembly-stacking protein 2 [Neodiprion pinetum]XP_046615326.1 Golgi reassembly-stacking protein 2 [Neodiprion virginianus]
MGSSQSVEIPGGGTEGYHVLRVQDGSPGQKAGLEAFFDFIVAIGNTRLDQDNDTLKELLKAGVDKELQITVYSSKTQSVRQSVIVPSMTWGGQGLLGVSIRFCSFEGANENVWHVLEVHPSSPAELAGLKSFTDYIISADSVLHESEDIFTLIEAHESRPLKLYVYNTNEDSCREVTVTPNNTWGGEGSLGCGLGYGYLHRIPIRNIPSPSVTASSHSYASNIKTPVTTTASTNVHISQSNPVTNIPPGFSIPPSYVTSNAAMAPPSAIKETVEPTTVSVTPVSPTLPQLDNVPQIDPVSAGATTTTATSTSHLFAGQSDVNLTQSSVQAAEYYGTPNIPGMPLTPPTPASMVNVGPPSGIPMYSTPLPNYNLLSGPTSAALPYNVSQPHMVTTPISLPGMPPITVSATLPQNHPYYPPVCNPNQAPVPTPGLPSTTASAQ